jgi:light-regulated signal transduction histidine kinase (bacteriophytochrome)
LEVRVEERTAQLLTANRELESFSYTVAHDLRGPLETISNICYLLQNNDAGTPTDASDPMGSHLLLLTRTTLSMMLVKYRNHAAPSAAILFAFTCTTPS